MTDNDPTTLDDVLKVLKQEVVRGIGETPPGSNINAYTLWFYNGARIAAPWCAIGQCWVENKAGGLLMPKTAYTPTMAQFFIDKKRFGKAPRIGALAFHNFPDSLDRIQHVSRVTSITNATTVRTVEFNTSSGTAGSQDDGGNVYPRTRRVGAGDIVGFGYPLYEEDVPEFFFPKEKTWFGLGDAGADIKTWQRHLNHWIKALDKPPATFRLEVTKKFDKDTLKATKTFQAHYKLDVDGRVGAHTIKRMEKVLERLAA